MSAHDVDDVVAILDGAGLPVWLDGGWGVDALVGRQTRPHDDLDVVIAGEHVATARDALRDHGFRVRVDELPTRLVLEDVRGRSIDVHPVTFDAEGGGTQVLQDGTTFRYPPEGFRGHGTVGGQRVRALTAEVQAICHHGYEPDAKDEHDMALLHEHFGIDLPAPYGRR